MDDRPYYYRLRGRTMGPIGLRQIRQLAQRAQIGRMTDVSRDGLQWAKAGDFPEIFQASGTEPPVAVGNPGGALMAEGSGDFLPTPAQAPRWYYTQQGAQQGPVDLVTLQQLVATGQVAASEYAITEGGAEWQPVSSLPQLAGVITGLTSIANGDMSNSSNHSTGSQQSQGANGLAIAGFVIALISLPFGCLCGLFSLPMSVLALIFSAIAVAGKNTSQRGLAIAGLVISIVAMIVAVVMVIIGIAITLPNF